MQEFYVGKEIDNVGESKAERISALMYLQLLAPFFMHEAATTAGAQMKRLSIGTEHSLLSFPYP